MISVSTQKPNIIFILADKYPKRINKMSNMLDKWMEDVEADRMSIDWDNSKVH